MLPFNTSLLCIAVFAFSSSAFGQIVGGGFLSEWEIDGPPGYGGYGASFVGDVNADGIGDFAVGSPSASPNGISNAGAVHVYSGVDGSLIHLFEGEFEGDTLGWTLAGAGDVNGDGYSDVLVSVPGYVGVLGFVRVYSGLDGTVLHNIEEVGFERLGWSLAGIGDIDADGCADFVLGAYLGGTQYDGKAYVISGKTGATLLDLIGNSPGIGFGVQVAGGRDIDGDGIPDIIVGACWASSNGLLYNGEVFLISGATGSIIHSFVGTHDFELLGAGASLHFIGDTDGDGVSEVAATGLLPYLKIFSTLNGILADSDQVTWAFPVGDIDENGIPDIYVGMGSSESEFQSGFDLSPIPIHTPNAADGQDIDGDGRVELIFGGSGLSYRVILYKDGSFLTCSSANVSAMMGASLQFSLRFPIVNTNYKILISGTGTGPTLYGIPIPLTLDSLVVDSFFDIYPISSHQGMHGILDVSGEAVASFDVPAGIPTSMIGTNFYFAAIAGGQTWNDGPPDFSSRSVTITVVP